MIGVLDQDYMTFARARGLSSWRILFVYSLRNALIPVVTISGVMLSSLIVGALFVENAFSIPGIGQLLVQSAQTKDIAKYSDVEDSGLGMFLRRAGTKGDAGLSALQWRRLIQNEGDQPGEGGGVGGGVAAGCGLRAGAPGRCPCPRPAHATGIRQCRGGRSLLRCLATQRPLGYADPNKL